MKAQPTAHNKRQSAAGNINTVTPENASNGQVASSPEETMQKKILETVESSEQVSQLKAFHQVANEGIQSKDPILQREEEEEEEKGEVEAAWKPLQMKSKDSPIQPKWKERVDGRQYGMIRWKQTKKDDEDGYYLPDGWYKAELDYRTYWAIPLTGTQQEDIRNGRLSVNIRPWVVKMTYDDDTTKSAETKNLPAVMKMVREIWKQGDIGIEVVDPRPLVIKLSRPLSEYKSKSDEFTDEINKAFQPILNHAIESDNAREQQSIQAVFIPSYDKWGFTYHKGDKGYAGPVTYMATETAGVGADGTMPREEDMHTDESDYVDTGIATDAAHEIGHAMGLEHDEGTGKVQFLMHKSLYHVIGNAEKMKKQLAIDIFKKRYNTEQYPILFKQKNDKGVAYWTVLHGQQISAQQAETVLDRVSKKNIW